MFMNKRIDEAIEAMEENSNADELIVSLCPEADIYAGIEDLSLNDCGNEWLNAYLNGTLDTREIVTDEDKRWHNFFCRKREKIVNNWVKENGEDEF